MTNDDKQCENTDTELWRKFKGDFYSPSIHVTKSGAIGINVAGHVIVMSIEKWHSLGKMRCAMRDIFES